MVPSTANPCNVILKSENSCPDHRRALAGLPFLLDVAKRSWGHAGRGCAHRGGGRAAVRIPVASSSTPLPAASPPLALNLGPAYPRRLARAGSPYLLEAAPELRPCEAGGVYIVALSWAAKHVSSAMAALSRQSSPGSRRGLLSRNGSLELPAFPGCAPPHLRLCSAPCANGHRHPA